MSFICTQVAWGSDDDDEDSDGDSNSSNPSDSDSSASDSDDQMECSDGDEDCDLATVPTSDSDSDEDTLHLAVSKSFRWEPGKELRIRFLGGGWMIRKKVKKYARQWQQYANINFNFTKHEPSDIRIDFRQDGRSWSRIGKSAWNVGPDKPTMNLAISASNSEARIRRVVLHEFGHALGCRHEHSSPATSIKWNEQAVYDAHSTWSKERVYRNILKRYSGTVTQFSQFDPKSIMLYSIPRTWTRDGWHSALNTRLSDTDKEFIAKIYPWPEDTKLSEPRTPRPTRSRLSGSSRNHRYDLRKRGKTAYPY